MKPLCSCPMPVRRAEPCGRCPSGVESLHPDIRTSSEPHNHILLRAVEQERERLGHRCPYCEHLQACCRAVLPGRGGEACAN